MQPSAGPPHGMRETPDLHWRLMLLRMDTMCLLRKMADGDVRRTK